MNCNWPSGVFGQRKYLDMSRAARAAPGGTGSSTSLGAGASTSSTGGSTSRATRTGRPTTAATATTGAIAGLDNHEFLLVPPGALEHIVQELFRGCVAVLRIATLSDDVVRNVRGFDVIEEPLGLVPVAALVDVDGDLQRRLARRRFRALDPRLQQTRQIVPLFGVVIPLRWRGLAVSGKLNSGNRPRRGRPASR